MASAQERNRRRQPAAAKEKEKPKKSLVGTLLELPQGGIGGMAQIQLMSNREALVDGCKGVLEYNEDFVRLNLGQMTARFCGRGLQLRSMSEEGLIIEGFIQSLEFIT